MKSGAKVERLREEAAEREQNKSETLQIRLEATLAQKINAIAAGKNVKVSTLVRTWLDKMVDQELSPQGQTSVREQPMSNYDITTQQMFHMLMDIQTSIAKLADDQSTTQAGSIDKLKKRK